MMKSFRNLHFLLFFTMVFCPMAVAQSGVTSLNGTWNFALDPTQSGESLGWPKPWSHSESDTNAYGNGWDIVQVPHCYSIDQRYEGYIGKVWYRKMFKYEGDIRDKHLRIRFEAVFYKCRIWLNGLLVGYHEGGYTPFEFDLVSQLQKGNNYLAIEVDNSWDHTTVPGARLGNYPSDLLYPWWEYGGITRDVKLIETARVYVVKQKIEAIPDLKKGTAVVNVKTWIRNTGNARATVDCRLSLEQNGSPISPDKKNSDITKSAQVPPAAMLVLEQMLSLPAEQVSLWHFEHPALYLLSTSLSGDNAPHIERFGIRKVESRHGKLMLNGQAIRVGGANRHADHPLYGSADNEALAKLDMNIIKNANMNFARLNHTPTSTAFMDWCDEHGFMVISEPGNWQISPQQMSDPVIRGKFISQMTELIERDWNRPSVVAWSMGNEYASWTVEGDAWTAEMTSIAKSLDNTRLITFVSIGGAGTKENLEVAHDSFRYCDFLCINTYGSAKGASNLLENLHAKYPDKAVFIAEFGQRADQHSEEERIAYFTEMMKMVRQKEYVIGTSWWSYNDYRSRYPGTHVNGYRPWGLVSPDREPRGLLQVMKQEYAPMQMTLHKSDKEGRVKVNILAREDYPSYTLSGYTLRMSDANGTEIKQIELKTLAPGETIDLELDEIKKGTVFSIISPTTFNVLEETW
ncbi:MAG: beta-galactosidase [Cyclobacteriaceae bacterium]|nr:beta-galactosidase [Cyclobacteriaceae bacterium]